MKGKGLMIAWFSTTVLYRLNTEIHVEMIPTDWKAVRLIPESNCLWDGQRGMDWN